MSQTKTGTDHWARACLHPSSVQWRWRIDESVPWHAHLCGIEGELGFCCSCCCLLIVDPRCVVTWAALAQPRLVILIRSVGSSQTSACLFASDWSLRWLARLTSMACGTGEQTFLSHSQQHTPTLRTRREAETIATRWIHFEFQTVRPVQNFSGRNYETFTLTHRRDNDNEITSFLFK